MTKRVKPIVDHSRGENKIVGWIDVETGKRVDADGKIAETVEKPKTKVQKVD